MRKKHEIDIVLDEQDAFINSYSTHDSIQGKVVLRFEKDTSFDAVQVLFEGQTNTYVEKVATTAPTAGRATGRHTFLRLVQPLEEAGLPEDLIARANTTYTIPFTFGIPDQLLPQICTHEVNDVTTSEEHHRLPPSFGDPMLAGDGSTLIDDMAPDMSKISYGIRVKVSKMGPNNRILAIADRAIKVRIVPATEERPPLDTSGDSKEYQLRKEKDVKRGLFKIGKIGRLAAEIVQPKSFRLAPPTSKSIVPISTMATINLRFDPNEDKDQPPALGNVATKLRAQTFFGAAPFRNIPTRDNVNPWVSSI